MLYEDDRVLYLACFDSDQLKQWLVFIKKAMHFSEWFTGIKSFTMKE